MAFAARQNVFDPIKLAVAQCISSHRSAPTQADHSWVRHLLSLTDPKHRVFPDRTQAQFLFLGVD
jgi:hypothetical protein